MTSDYDDTLYIGYYPNGQSVGTYGNISSDGSPLSGGNGTAGSGDRGYTDGINYINTVDLAAGDDKLYIRGNQIALTRVYLGEGDDEYVIGGYMDGDGFIFAESGNDTVLIGYAPKRDALGNVVYNAEGKLQYEPTSDGAGVASASKIYLGSGSDTFAVRKEFEGLLDLGSGRAMPAEYLATYSKESSLSLGNDNNTDLSTDTNHVSIGSYVNNAQIYGGAGDDILTIGGYIGGAKAIIDLGDGNNKVTVAEGMNANSELKTGSGNDVVEFKGAIGDNVTAGYVDLGAGDDILIVSNIQTYLTSKVSGGAGYDQLHITGGTTSEIAVNIRSISGFEEIHLDGRVQLDLAYDRLKAGNNGIVRILGSNNDKVDLGDNDVLGSTNLGDGFGQSWSKQAAPVTEGAVTYDVYKHSSDSASDHLVYIQQGIVII